MKKPRLIQSGFKELCPCKTLRIMKLTLLLLILGLMQVSANVFSQNQRLSLNLQNATIKQALNEIEESTNLKFLYRDRSVENKIISITADNQPVDQILEQILANSGNTYRLMENNLIIIGESDLMQPGRQVTGRVTNAAGDPLPGVTVVLKGTVTGVVSNMNGDYTIGNLSEGAVLVFSFVGMKSQEIEVGNQVTINVTLMDETIGIEEVVAVGYGSQKRVNVIGSISQITSEQFESRSVPLLSNALAGQMTGVTVITRSGAPGNSPGTIRIRGVGSFGASPDALVLVDGIPGNINDVRPEEVESISVLKDASSAAIYGARAANGVILITTKAGKSEKVKVNYNGYAGFVAPTAMPEFLDSWDYALAFNEASGTQRYSADDIQKFKSGTDPINFPNTNMLKEVISRNGLQTGHDLTLTGGSDINQYYLAVGYLSQDGVVEKNNYSRYSARLNMISALTPKLKLTSRLAGFTSTIKEPAVPGGKDVARMADGIIRNAVRYPSVYTTRLPDGNYGIGPESGGTSAAWLDSPSFWEDPTWKISSNFNLEYKPFKDLVLSAIGGYNFTYSETKFYRSTMRLNDNVTMGPSSLEQTAARTQYQTFQTTADYNLTIKSHNISALAGYSFEKQGFRDLTAFRDKFPGNDLPFLDAGSPDNQQSSGGGNDWAIQSVFGRLRYNFEEKYLLESTLRYDGSSRFPPTRKYGLFPSVAVGWRISEESFIKDSYPWVSNLKLKASMGKLGNQNIGNYPWQSVYNLGRNYPIGGVFVQGASMTTLTDPTLRWENTQTSDAGIETLLWNGKLMFNASYFHRNTSDILYRPTSSVSTVLGMNLSEMNTGSLKNTGWEFELGHMGNAGDFKYNINGNFSVILNEVIDLGVGNVLQPNGLVGNGVDLFIGYPMQLYYGLTTDGVFLDQADIDAWYATNDQSGIMPKNSARPGDFRYVDISGDGKVDLSNDRKILGSQIPKYTFGLNIGFDYKGLDFSAMLQGVAGVEGMINNYAGFAFFNLGTVQKWMWEGRFDPANPTRYPDYPRLQVLGNAPGVNGQLSDFWVLDASYLRVKNIQLGYTIPKSLLNRMGVDGLRIYTSVENLITFNNYRKGWDPEINSGGDYYPILATYSFGINLKF
jgi:TonB-linked SusC/RagA family outer membrane protein